MVLKLGDVVLAAIRVEYPTSCMHVPGAVQKKTAPQRPQKKYILYSLHPLFVYAQVTHKEPEAAVDHIALRGVKTLRWTFDVLAGFKTGVIDEHKCESDVWLDSISVQYGSVASRSIGLIISRHSAKSREGFKACCEAGLCRLFPDKTVV